MLTLAITEKSFLCRLRKIHDILSKKRFAKNVVFNTVRISVKVSKLRLILDGFNQMLGIKKRVKEKRPGF